MAHSNTDNQKTEVLNADSGSTNRSNPSPKRQSAHTAPSPRSPQQKTEVLYSNKPPELIGLLVSPQDGKTFTLSQVNVIGRDDNSNCDIRFSDPSMSSQHAIIKLEIDEEHGLRYFVQDFATTNGTKVNGKEIIRHYLQDGDRIELGQVQLVYKQI